MDVNKGMMNKIILEKNEEINKLRDKISKLEDMIGKRVLTGDLCVGKADGCIIIGYLDNDMEFEIGEADDIRLYSEKTFKEYLSDISKVNRF